MTRVRKLIAACNCVREHFFRFPFVLAYAKMQNAIEEIFTVREENGERACGRILLIGK